MDDLELYKITVDENDDIGFSGVNMISLVEDPAMAVDWMAFGKQQMLHFAADKQELIGPLIIPNIKILRFTEDKGYFNVTFPVDVITLILEKFQKNGFAKNINIHHSDRMVDGFLMEVWQKEFDQDKSVALGFDLPIGTLFGKVKIDDAQFWKDSVKTKEVKGFSVELLSGLELVDQDEALFCKIQKILKTVKAE